MSSFTSKMDQVLASQQPSSRFQHSPTPGGVDFHPPQWDHPRNPEAFVQSCLFCSAQDHFVRDCPTALRYINQGKLAWNSFGRICLPDGSFPPRDIPGINLRDRFENFWSSNRTRERRPNNQDTISTHFLEGPEEIIFEVNIPSPESSQFSHPPPEEEEDNLEERIRALEARMEAMREARSRRTQVNRVEVPRIASSPPREVAPVHPRPPVPPTRTHSPPLYSTSNPDPLPSDASSWRSRQPSSRAPAVARWPGVRTDSVPHRDLRISSKFEVEEAKFQPPDKSPVQIYNIADQFPSSQVPISTHERSAASSEVWKPVEDLTTTRKVSSNAREPFANALRVSVNTRQAPANALQASPSSLEVLNEPEVDALVAYPINESGVSSNESEVSANPLEASSPALVVSNKPLEDPLDNYLNSFNSWFESESLSTDPGLAEEPENSPAALDIANYEVSPASAPHSLPLRVIFPSFAPGIQPECILDGGAQVVVMRKDVWQQLDTPIIEKRIPMESANSETSMTLGFVENHPVQLGPVTFYLQIHVVEDAPFEVLLGRPFFDVLSCSEVSQTGGKHEIRIKDPEKGTPYVFSTKPRSRRTPRSPNHLQDESPAVVRVPSPSPLPRETAPQLSNAFEADSEPVSPESEYSTHTLPATRTSPEDWSYQDPPSLYSDAPLSSSLSSPVSLLAFSEFSDSLQEDRALEPSVPEAFSLRCDTSPQFANAFAIDPILPSPESGSAVYTLNRVQTSMEVWPSQDPPPGPSCFSAVPHTSPSLSNPTSLLASFEVFAASFTSLFSELSHWVHRTLFVINN